MRVRLSPEAAREDRPCACDWAILGSRPVVVAASTHYPTCSAVLPRPRDRAGAPCASQRLGTAVHRILPDAAAVVVEDQGRILGGREPGPAHQLGFELPRTPAGIAEGDQALLRALG